MVTTLDKSLENESFQQPKTELTVRQWRTLLKQGKVKVGKETITHADGPFKVKEGGDI